MNRSSLKTTRDQYHRGARQIGFWLVLPLICILTASGCSISSQIQQQLKIKTSLSGARIAPVGSVVTESAGASSTLDLDSFGASDSSLRLAASATIEHGPLRFFIDHIGTSNIGNGTYEGPLGGADLPLDSYRLETDLSTSRVLMEFPVPGIESDAESPLDLRIVAGLNLTELRVALQSIATPTTFSEIDELAPAPIVGVHANYAISPSWNLDAIFTLLPLSEITDYDAECVDNLIRIGWSPSADWNLFLGARNHSVELIGEQAGRPTEIDLELDLVEIGVSYSF
ncbi:MAG: hypothetical protein VX764_10530 [Planctomycetota bacterium]|nr:hypothetical protein [Planctomycetota bacterium]